MVDQFQNNYICKLPRLTITSAAASLVAIFWALFVLLFFIDLAIFPAPTHRSSLCSCLQSCDWLGCFPAGGTAFNEHNTRPTVFEALKKITDKGNH